MRIRSHRPALHSPCTTLAPFVADHEALGRLRPAFVRALAREFDLGALAGRLCPVLLEGSYAALFALADYVHGDQADELERLMRKRGYRLAAPARYVLPSPLLLAVAREAAGAPGLHAADHPAQRRTALQALFFDMVRWGVRHGASDLHLHADRRAATAQVRYTVGGAYVAAPCFNGLSHACLLEILAVAWMDVRAGNGAVFDPRAEQQGRIALQVDEVPVVLRWASLATDHGPSVCLRILRQDPPQGGASLAELGYLPAQVATLERACQRAGGAVVLAGTVGAGKSTTIATMLRGLPAERKLVTLEDPAEYAIANALQNSVSRSLDGEAGAPFDAKLLTIKRSAMHDLYLGEVRDRQTGRVFTDLAGSGVSLYTTTHAGSALLIPERLASDFIGVSRDFLATPGVLKLLVYQTLLPRLCPACALPLAVLWRRGAGWSHAQRLAWRCWPRACAAPAPRRRGAGAGARAQSRRLRGLRGRRFAGPARLRGAHRGRRTARTGNRRRPARSHPPARQSGAAPLAGRRARRQPPDAPLRAVDCAWRKVEAGAVDPRLVERCFALPPALRTPAGAEDGHG
ncbi:ATPase, T2SS/T4P/T4SS family [Bordetella pertussis]|uniref:ATPase, T2SS/T4P/T4SS family n=1 Tax=Bordetella pertussis TaxID=520 RepID=UPI0010C53BA5|nr:ATPase, T2SS/T4P/T4SS family [Bordetella pertussis]VTP83724.1 general secretion pathway protein [Bordetella pertussis]